MKTKQLANILIKILGLSVVVHGIPSLIAGFFGGLQMTGMNSQAGVFSLYLLSSLILPAIGIFLILKSREVTAFLFKAEDE